MGVTSDTTPLPGEGISVAIASCNGARYLPEQLDSILHQELPVSEIVVCDDASCDSTWELLQQYRAEYPALFHLERNSVRLGCSANFQKAVSLTHGTCIFLADQDDVWLPEKTRVMVDELARFPEAGGCFSDSAITDETLHPAGISHWEKRGFSAAMLQAVSGNGMELLKLFLKRVPAAGHDMMFKSSCKEFLLPFPALAGCHDSWTGLCLAALGSWCFTPRQLTLFRQHGSNASGSGKNGGALAKLREARRSIRENSFLWNAELYDELIRHLGKRCTPETLALLRDREAHSRRRAQMACPLPQRLPLIAKEIQNGRYFRHGRSWYNIVQDLVLRKPW